MIYERILNVATGQWQIGAIADHQARQLTEEEMTAAIANLNARPVEAKAEAGEIPGHMAPDGIFEYHDLKSGDLCPWCKTKLVNIQAHQGSPSRVYCMGCTRFPNESKTPTFTRPAPAANTEGLREALRDEIVRLMYAGHGHPAENRIRFCDYAGDGECPQCSAVDNMDAALRGEGVRE